MGFVFCDFYLTSCINSLKLLLIKSIPILNLMVVLGLLASCNNDSSKGCTNSNACNYDASVEEDDGSCTYICLTVLKKQESKNLHLKLLPKLMKTEQQQPMPLSMRQILCLPLKTRSSTFLSTTLAMLPMKLPSWFPMDSKTNLLDKTDTTCKMKMENASCVILLN